MGQSWYDRDPDEPMSHERAAYAATRISEGDRIAAWLKERATLLPLRERMALEEAAAALVRGEHRRVGVSR